MSDRTRAAAGYTRNVLAWYDLFVLGAVCPLVWRCHRREMLAVYDRNVGARHLDLGPGTGYFLGRCRFPANPRLVLVDNSDTVLRTASRRAARHRPVTRRRDVLDPLDLGDEVFDSVGMNFLLHCLPGGMAGKAAVFDRVLPYLAPGARIFGSTVLAHGVDHGPLAPRALASLNGDGTMDNLDDSLDGLDAELSARFTRYELTVRGSVCLFEIET
ncbi:class I SAM-dependent methyltransferase [Actinokineospora fastidiosa]|uniref:Methyltransferase n=1 Tax=Actinokineospora fastidiosa TaxID=1816 RepID=A0A918LHE2_9PSEU|nr:class I SAM-dependent methyltransferase [Actinokineospora fastidiosa]GGS46836.1 methyltransferase [Actinokineospora fastidiosa]